MTPETLIAAAMRGMVEALMSVQQPAKVVPQKRHRSSRRGSSRPAPAMAPPPIAPPPVQQSMFVEPGTEDRLPSQAELDAILNQAEAALRGDVPPGTRIPGEGDQSWMASG